MKDWNAIARGQAPDIPASSLKRIAVPLDALEAAFRPLARELTPQAEPAIAFLMEEDAE